MLGHHRSPYDLFQDLGLDEDLCAAIAKLGFEEPTKIS